MAGPHIGQLPVIWDLPSYPGLIVNEGEQLSQLFLQLPHDSRMKPSSSAEHLSSDSSQSQNHKSAGDSALLRLPFDRGCHSPWWEMQIPAWTIPPGPSLVMCSPPGLCCTCVWRAGSDTGDAWGEMGWKGEAVVS